jgi:hypothetical protein
VLFVESFNSHFEGRFRTSIKQFAAAETCFRERTTGTSWERSTMRLFRAFALKYHGAMSGLDELFWQAIADARARGDRYLETTMRIFGTIIWLVRDDPEGGRGSLARATWMPPEGVFHLQHWHEIEALTDLVLYEGSGATTAADLEPRFAAFRASLLLRVQIVRAVYCWVRGRLLLAAAAAGTAEPKRVSRELAHLARLLERERIGYATVYACELRAARAALDGNAEAAVAELDCGITAAGDQMLLHAAAARRRKGQLLGGDQGAALVAEADAWMKSEHIVNPARMTEVYLPGRWSR